MKSPQPRSCDTITMLTCPSKALYSTTVVLQWWRGGRIWLGMASHRPHKAHLVVYLTLSYSSSQPIQSHFSATTSALKMAALSYFSVSLAIQRAHCTATHACPAHVTCRHAQVVLAGSITSCPRRSLSIWPMLCHVGPGLSMSIRHARLVGVHVCKPIGCEMGM